MFLHTVLLQQKVEEIRKDTSNLQQVRYTIRRSGELHVMPSEPPAPACGLPEPPVSLDFTVSGPRTQAKVIPAPC